MNVLAVETSTPFGSVALLTKDNQVTEKKLERGAQQGRLIAPCVQELLDNHQLTPRELDLFVVGLGPGSYTGIRVGIALAKAFSFGAQCPLVGVCSFASMAKAHGREGDRMLTLAPAGRHDFAYALYEIKNRNLKEVQAPTIGFEADILALKDSYDRVLGEGADRIFKDAAMVRPSARDGIHLGKELFLKQGPMKDREVQPLYLRPSTAEINWKKR